jgi:hypothetical protein
VWFYKSCSLAEQIPSSTKVSAKFRNFAWLVAEAQQASTAELRTNCVADCHSFTGCGAVFETTPQWYAGCVRLQEESVANPDPPVVVRRRLVST